MNIFRLTISSPDGHLFEGDAVKFFVRGVEGNLAVMAGHVPFITAVKECDCRIVLPDGTEKTGHTAGGLLHVSDEGTVFLADVFNW